MLPNIVVLTKQIRPILNFTKHNKMNIFWSQLRVARFSNSQSGTSHSVEREARDIIPFPDTSSSAGPGFLPGNFFEILDARTCVLACFWASKLIYKGAILGWRSTLFRRYSKNLKLPPGPTPENRYTRRLAYSAFTMASRSTHGCVL